MTPEYEECKAHLEDLIQWYTSYHGSRNEATTRLHIIDRLLFECLGWDRQDVSAEESHQGTYTDYSLTTTRPILILEAKKEGAYFTLPAGKPHPRYKIRGLKQDIPKLGEAIQQVMMYCQDRGVPFGAVCNGHQLVALIATRTDGVAPDNADALVFPSLDTMLSRFTEFWDALSKAGLQDNRLGAMLCGARRPLLPPKLSASLHTYPGSKRRNVFQAELQIVAEHVLEDLTRIDTLEERFLEQCYCRSGALSQHSTLSKKILLARYAALFDSRTGAPTTVPAKDGAVVSTEAFAASLSRRPILLIGDVGVGKSIFVRHLIRVAAPRVFEKAVTLYLDLGTEATLTTSLTSYITGAIRSQLREQYNTDIEEKNFIHGVYNLELEDFRRGLYGDLQQDDPQKYLAEEIRFLENQVRDAHKHLRRSLEHIQKARRKQIIVFLDNIDQREPPMQEAAYLAAHEMAANWPVTVFLALRPETFNQSRSAGVLAGYHPKAFTIAPPRIDRVVERRLKFAKALTQGDIVIEANAAATFHLDKLDTLLDALLFSIDKNKELIECLDNLAAGNVRLALDTVRAFLGSGHVDTAKIVEQYLRPGRYIIPLHELLRAVIYGDTEYYDPDHGPIVNVFDVYSEDPKEHFLVPLTIACLKEAGRRDGSTGYVESRRFYDELQSMGFVPEQIDRAIVKACKRRLAEAAGNIFPASDEATQYQYRPTTLGAYHLLNLLPMFQYVDAMIVDTPILDSNVRSQIHDEAGITGRLRRCEAFRRYLDKCWERFDCRGTPLDWKGISAKLEAHIQLIKSKAGRKRG